MLTIFITGCSLGALGVAIWVFCKYRKPRRVPDEYGYEDAATWSWPAEMLN